MYTYICMIKMKDIINETISTKKKAFGDRATRVSREEMFLVFNELKQKLGKYFKRFEIAKALPSKIDFGDIDIVVLNDKGLDIQKFLREQYGNAILDTLKSGNVNSFLFQSQALGKSVHVDILTTGSEEDFNPQLEYLSYGDLAGILGVMSRRLRFLYGTEGFFKIYIDPKGRYHYVFLTKNLRDGLKILGYSDFVKYDNIQTLDDVADFISSSPLFDSEYYKSMGMNNSDRKRCRIGRPSADYIRNKLRGFDKQRSVNDDDYFLKKLYPQYYDKLQKDIEEINKTVVNTAKYTGEWLINQFNVKPGPIIGKIKLYWKEKFGDDIDSVPEEQVIQATKEFLAKL